VAVEVQHRESAVLGCGCGDERIGERHTVVSVAVSGECRSRSRAGGERKHGWVVVPDEAEHIHW
jgi:hypothetical protein